MSNYVRLCPKNTVEFLTFRREVFFVAAPGRVAIVRIFLSSLVNQGFFSVSLYQHHGDFLPPGDEKRLFSLSS